MNGLGNPGPFVFLVGLRPLVLFGVWELQHGAICGALLFAMLPALITKRKVEVLFFSYFDVRYRSPAAAMDGWAGFLVKHHLATCLWVSGQVRAYGNCYGFGFCMQVCGLASRLATGMHGLCASQFR